MLRILSTLLLLVATPGGAALSQAPEPGTEIRLLLPSPNPFDGVTRQRALFDEVRGDSLWVTTPEGPVSVLAATSGATVRTDQNYSTAGALIGFAAGALVGALVGNVRYEPEYKTSECTASISGISTTYSCRNIRPEETSSQTWEVIGAASIGGLAGGLGGFVIGSVVKKWAPLHFDHLQVSPRGVAVGLKVDP